MDIKSSRIEAAKEISEMQRLGCAPLGLVERVLDGEFDEVVDLGMSISEAVDCIVDVSSTASGGKC
jgi:hypothetical protein